jgi:hypothetical protein
MIVVQPERTQTAESGNPYFEAIQLRCVRSVQSNPQARLCCDLNKGPGRQRKPTSGIWAMLSLLTA